MCLFFARILVLPQFVLEHQQQRREWRRGDLDLTFAVADNFPISDVLEDWTPNLVAEFDATHLFDLPSGASIYRVFLLPGCLQFDLSFTPASKFGATSPKFKIIFGNSVEKP